MSDTTETQHARGVMGMVTGLGAGFRGVVEESVKSSWQRCVNDYHLDPSRLHAPSVVGSGSLKDLQSRHEELVDIARAEMDVLYDHISGSGYALLLTDAQGIILTEKIDPNLSRMFRSAGLITGADWSEQTEGTNGIGTCIATARPITIHRADHFRARHIGLSCTGAPIRDLDGQFIAVLDASAVGAHDTRTSQMHTMALVNTSAHMIEKCLFLRRAQPYRILRFHSRPEFVNLLHDGALALADDGTVVAADRTAVALLSRQSRANIVGRQVNELFDIGNTDIDELSSPRQALFPARDGLGRRFFLSLMQPQRPAHFVDFERPRPSYKASIQITPSLVPPPMTLEYLGGEDAQMRRSTRSATRIADSQVTVLIQGPTGSGKEAFAKALHMASPRASNPFVAVNCAAIPESLIEAELFGYTAGAFTGARKDGMRGRIQQASSGTLFLDEIGDMPLMMQTRLLRVLEEQEVTPLGSERAIKVDLRVISASHRRLRDMIAAGSFREDLYYRLNGITLELPALSERADAEQLIRGIIASEARGRQSAVNIEADAFNCLLTYPWPGNIRELRNVIRTALAVCDDDLVRRSDLPREIRDATSSPAPASATALAKPAVRDELPAPPRIADGAQPITLPARPGASPLEIAERAAILAAVQANRWNMTLTAQQFGISRNTLYRKLKRHGIPVGDARRDEVSGH